MGEFCEWLNILRNLRAEGTGRKSAAVAETVPTPAAVTETVPTPAAVTETIPTHVAVTETIPTPAAVAETVPVAFDVEALKNLDAANLRKRGRPKGADLTAIGVPKRRKRDGPQQFLAQLPMERERGIYEFCIETCNLRYKLCGAYDYRVAAF